MIQIHEEYLKNNLKTYSKELSDLNKNVLKKIKNFKKTHGSKFDVEQNRYLNSIISNLKIKNFLQIGTKEIKALKKAIGKVPEGDILYNGKNVPFKELIERKFNYKELRSDFLPKFYYSLDIKTCVYCNANFTTTIEKENNLYEARYQFDHVLPQADYPHFSVSIYNLVPSCFKCNNNKSKKLISFEFFTNGIPKNDYLFSLEKNSIINYLKKFDNSLLKVEFYDPNELLNKSKSIEGNFFISKIYNEHKDIAEEILVKSYIYNKDHLTDLKKFISDKMPSIKIPLDRLFIGNYINEKDLLKRPMTKFTKDIFNEIQRLKFDIDKELKI